MTILITGASGFLGKHVNNFLFKFNIIFELSKPNAIKKTRLEQEIPAFNCNFDLVIHCAGKAHLIPKTEEEKKQFFQVNVTGTRNLLKGLSLSGLPKQFVFISSVSVYGKEEGLNISENEKLNANDLFGLSKIQAEQLVIEWCQKNNVVCTILRLPLLVGKNPPGNLGAMIKAIRKGYYFNIEGGNSKKSMVLAEDVARFIPLIAPVGGTYNLTDGVHPSFEKLSTALAKKKTFNLPLFFARILGYIGDLFGKNFPINTAKIKKITSNLTFDDSKARSIGWKSQSVLDYLKNNDL
jgi:nucleoside-diphosphate-sugar epimerase